MGSLTIEFRGACTHFRDVVPGVPHRTVLVNATAIRFGTLEPRDGVDDEWLADEEAYVLFPHGVFLCSDKLSQRELDAPGAIVDGSFYAGAHLQIVNTIDEKLQYGPSFATDIPRITDYVDRYQYSPDVVLGGRAACYFDVFSGFVDVVVADSAVHAQIRVTTNGDPVLRVTPFASPRHTDITFPDEATLRVDHRDIHWLKDGPRYDFLLHFLTANAGIPRHLKRAPYGSDVRSSFSLPTSDDYADQMKKLLDAGWPPRRGTAGRRIKPAPPRMDNSASCSDSQYP